MAGHGELHGTVPSYAIDGDFRRKSASIDPHANKAVTVSVTGQKYNATSDYAVATSDKYASAVDSADFVDASAGGPVKVKSMDGKEYIDLKGGINYDVGEINRSYKAGDVRSGKIVLNDADDGMLEFASGMKTVNNHENYMKFLEAQSSQSKKKEYSWDVDLAAAEGVSVDASIEKERQRLAKESRERKAKEAAKIAKQNKAIADAREKDAVTGQYALIVDDDIMDEAAGRERLRLAAESKKRREESVANLQMTHAQERRRIKNVPSKIHSWNDNWNSNISRRKSEEQTLSALLSDMRAGVQGGESRDALHGLEKKLAGAQNWVVTPPSSKDPIFAKEAAPTSPLGWDGPESANPMNLLH